MRCGAIGRFKAIATIVDVRADRRAAATEQQARLIDQVASEIYHELRYA